jgi:hypothetical protein
MRAATRRSVQRAQQPDQASQASLLAAGLAACQHFAPFVSIGAVGTNFWSKMVWLWQLQHAFRKIGRFLGRKLRKTAAAPPSGVGEGRRSRRGLVVVAAASGEGLGGSAMQAGLVPGKPGELHPLFARAFLAA